MYRQALSAAAKAVGLGAALLATSGCPAPVASSPPAYMPVAVVEPQAGAPPPELIENDADNDLAPPIDKRCAGSWECEEQGACSYRKTGCVARYNQHCQHSARCRAAGYCTARDNACVIASAKDCAGSEGCRAEGECGFDPDRMCVAKIDDHCRSAQLCAEQGRCGEHQGSCIAVSTADCRQSTLCKQQGLCVLQTDQCSKLAAPKKFGAKHILVQYQGARRAKSSITRSKQQALARAKMVAKRAVTAGASKFGGIVAQFSDEPGSAKRGGDLGLWRKGSMVHSFQQAVEATAVGAISGAFETPFGYHIILRTQ